MFSEFVIPPRAFVCVCPLLILRLGGLLWCRVLPRLADLSAQERSLHTCAPRAPCPPPCTVPPVFAPGSLLPARGGLSGMILRARVPLSARHQQRVVLNPGPAPHPLLMGLPVFQTGGASPLPTSQAPGCALLRSLARHYGPAGLHGLCGIWGRNKKGIWILVLLESFDFFNLHLMCNNK